MVDSMRIVCIACDETGFKLHGIYYTITIFGADQVNSVRQNFVRIWHVRTMVLVCLWEDYLSASVKMDSLALTVKKVKPFFLKNKRIYDDIIFIRIFWDTMLWTGGEFIITESKTWIFKHPVSSTFAKMHTYMSVYYGKWFLLLSNLSR